MPWTTPMTWVAGSYPTAAQFNTHIRDNVSFLGNPPMCHVYKAAAQSLNDATETTLTFDAERYDTDTMHDNTTNPERITIRTAGVYVVTFSGTFAGATDYAATYGYLRLNGTTTLDYHSDGAMTAADGNPTIRLSIPYKFAVNDYVEVRAYQNNTGNVARNLTNRQFTATWVGFG